MIVAAGHNAKSTSISSVVSTTNRGQPQIGRSKQARRYERGGTGISTGKTERDQVSATEVPFWVRGTRLNNQPLMALTPTGTSVFFCQAESARCPSTFSSCMESDVGRRRAVDMMSWRSGSDTAIATITGRPDAMDKCACASRQRTRTMCICSRGVIGEPQNQASRSNPSVRGRVGERA